MTLPPDNNGPDDVQNAIGDVDPIKWLESLAARQGANPEEFITAADLDVPEVGADAAVDEPGYSSYDPYGAPGAVAAKPPASPPQDSAASSADSGDVDPLAWLESLARRQGANPEEFVTQANLEIEEVDARAVKLDEPGYTPYTSTPQPAPAAPTPAAPAPEPSLFMEGDLSASEAAELLGLDTDQLMPVMEDEEEEEFFEAPIPAAPAPPPAPPVMAAASASDPTSGEVDPLAWLESLARRQGVRAEELITSADLNVPEAAADAVVDEPGYSDYSPFAAAEPEEEQPHAAPLPAMPSGMLEEEIPSGGDTLAWLEGLAVSEGAAPLPVAAAPTPEADSLDGLSDAEIEARAAEGLLTPLQMQAWLDRQADSLARARIEAELSYQEEEVAPAEPAELPPWLLEAIPGEEAAAPAGPAPLVEEIVEPPQPADLPAWIAEAPAEPEVAYDLAEEIEADASDTWVRALDHEYVTKRIKQSEEEMEDWYEEALQTGTVEVPTLEPLAAEPDFLAEEPEFAGELAAPEAAELPDWLRAEVEGGDVPDWLLQPIGEAEEATALEWLEPEPEVAGPEFEPAAEIPDWLQEAAVQPVELPDWLQEAAPTPPPAPAPAPAVPAPAAAPAPPPAAAPAPAPARAAAPPPARVPAVPLSAAVPAGAAYDRYRAALESNPQDHGTRLELARKLNEDNRILDSLGQYESLVFSEAQLSQLEVEVGELVQARPDVPQARRVLGDIFMREGRLQDALDTYRSALEQL